MGHRLDASSGASRGSHGRRWLALAAAGTCALAGHARAQQLCDDHPGVTTRLLTPTQITTEGAIAIEISNNSQHYVSRADGCWIESGHEGVDCTGPEVPPYFSCPLIVMELAPGESVTDVWVPLTTTGEPLPPGHYSLHVGYAVGLSPYECCIPVEVVDAVTVPAMPAWGLFGTAAVLALAGAWSLRRRLGPARTLSAR